MFADLSGSREVAGQEDKLYHRLVRVERHPNGGATVVHLYEEDLAHLPGGSVHSLADVFFRYVHVCTLLQTSGWTCVMATVLTERCSGSQCLASQTT